MILSGLLLEDNFLVFGYPEEGGAIQMTPARLAYRGTHGTMPAATWTWRRT